MRREGPLLLTIEELQEKDPEMFTEMGFTRNFIGSLFTALILLGYMDKAKRKLLVSLNTWENLKLHIAFVLYTQAKTFDKNFTFKIPVYLDNHNCNFSYAINEYFRAGELLDHYSELRNGKFFTESLLGQCAHKHILRAKYDFSESCMLISKPSFDDLLRLRNYNIDQNLKFNPDNE